MILIERFKGDGFKSDAPPLTWWPIVVDQLKASVKATMKCSHGHVMTLRGHEIAPDGAVSPSVVCPQAGCDFHEFVTLKEWGE